MPENIFKHKCKKKFLIVLGNSKVYVFSQDVRLMRENSTKLEDDDFIGSKTNLVEALKTIIDEMNKCVQHQIRIFILTDGQDTASHIDPSEIIKKMKTPVGKMVYIYIVCFGNRFPVNYGLDIWSLLDNGPVNIPSLFYVQYPIDICELMSNLASELHDYVKCNLSMEGCILPGTSKQKSCFLDEWLFFEESPDFIKDIQINLDNGTNIAVDRMENFPLPNCVHNLFPQWNSVISKMHRNKEMFDHRVFDLMEGFCKNYLTQAQSSILKNINKVTTRLKLKPYDKVKTLLSILMSRSQELIKDDGLYQTDIVFAAAVLKTTIKTNIYTFESSKVNEHRSEDYKKVVDDFISIYQNIRQEINDLPDSEPDECCIITMSSTLSDLQDSSFIDLLQENKFVFLSNFTLTGMPVLRKISENLNPWSIYIYNILTNPFEILSQRVLELGESTGNSPEKITSVTLKKTDPSTKFNAVISLIPENSIEVLKPLLQSELYAMCCTFSIMQNVHIIDYEYHVAAMACALLKTIHEYPSENRPEFIKKRIELIESTSKIYTGYPSLKNYAQCLLKYPQHALKSDSGKLFKNVEIKCESILKPAYILFIYRKEINFDDRISEIFELMLTEFIGRCFEFLRKDQTPFSNVFLISSKNNIPLYEDICYNKIFNDNTVSKEELLRKYYTPEKMIKDIVQSDFTDLIEENIKKTFIKVPSDIVKNMNSLDSCGGVSMDILKSLANEMKISKNNITSLFSDDMILVYTYYALKYPSSQMRMSEKLVKKENIRNAILKEICAEQKREIQKMLKHKSKTVLTKQWLSAYRSSHDFLVPPMNKNEIIKDAVKQGIDVNEETFSTVYKFRENVGLLMNACQSQNCPHYLRPHKNFNQHISIERKKKNFPHNLHNVSIKV